MGVPWKTFRVRRFKGLDLKTNVVDVRDGYSLGSENAYQNGSGKISLRRGNEVMFAEDEAGTVPNQSVGACVLAGTKYYFKISDGKFHHAASRTGAVTTLTPSPSIATDGEIWFAVLDDKLFFVDGTNGLRYFDGTAIKSSAIYERPTVAATCAGGAGGFTYLYTVDNGLGESPAVSNLLVSELSAATIRVAGNTGPQTLIAGDIVRIYSRADTIAAASKLVATYTWQAADVTAGFADIPTVAISDTQIQLYSELGLALNKTAPSALTGIGVHMGRLVGWKGSRVHNSKSSNPHSWPDDSAQKEAFVYGFGLGDGETISVCISYKESLYVLKPSDAAVFGGIGPDDAGGNAYSFRRLEVNGKGCIAGKSAQVIGEEKQNFLAWLSRYGFMGTDGGKPISLGESIETQIQGIDDVTLVTSCAYYDKKLGLYICFVGGPSSRVGWALDVRKEKGEDGEEQAIGWFKYSSLHATSVFYDIDRTFYGLASGVCLSERVSGTPFDFSDVTQEYIETSGVDATDNEIAVARSYQTADPVKIRSSGAVPAPLVANTTYYAIRVSATVIQLATTAENASAGTAINLTDVGTGTHSLVGAGLIPNYYTTNWINFGSAVATKKLSKPAFIFNAIAQAVNMTISFAYDYGNVFQSPKTLIIGSSDAWGESPWGDFVWGSGAQATPKNIGLPKRKVRAIRYRFSVGVINQDFELLGMEQEADKIRSRGGYA